MLWIYPISTLYSLLQTTLFFFALSWNWSSALGHIRHPREWPRNSRYSNSGFPWPNYRRYRFNLADSNVAMIFFYSIPTLQYLTLAIEAGIKRRVWISAKPEAIAHLPDAESPCSSPWWMLECLIGKIKNVSEPSLRFRDILTHPF